MISQGVLHDAGVGVPDIWLRLNATASPNDLSRRRILWDLAGDKRNPLLFGSGESNLLKREQIVQNQPRNDFPQIIRCHVRISLRSLCLCEACSLAEWEFDTRPYCREVVILISCTMKML